MTKEVSTTTNPEQQANPFARPIAEHINAGAVEIESTRAIAEVQARLLIAQRFPRNQANAFAAIMEACSRRSFAEQAFYAYPKSGQTVKGLSIRFAEEAARLWGNIEFGITELSQKNGISEMLAYCWDLQCNTISPQKFTVRHERHTRNGVNALTDPRDVYELTANLGARRLRARILAMLPADLLEAAEEQLNRTLQGKSDVPIGDRIKKMLVAFAKYGVTKELIEKRASKKLEEFFEEDVAELVTIFNSIRDAQSKASEWFGVKEQGENSALNALGAANPHTPNDTTK